MDALPPPGTQLFLPSLLAHVRAALPGFPLEPVIVQVLLLCIISGDKNLVLRTRDEDVTLVSKLTTLVGSRPSCTFPTRQAERFPLSVPRRKRYIYVSVSRPSIQFLATMPTG